MACPDTPFLVSYSLVYSSALLPILELLNTTEKTILERRRRRLCLGPSMFGRILEIVTAKETLYMLHTQCISWNLVPVGSKLFVHVVVLLPRRITPVLFWASSRPEFINKKLILHIAFFAYISISPRRFATIVILIWSAKRIVLCWEGVVLTLHHTQLTIA